MPVEFENGIKKCRFGLPFTRCRFGLPFTRQNFVSVSKTAKFVILPFSNSAGIVQTHFAGRILCRFRHEANIFNPPIIFIVVVVMSILVDY